MIAAAARMKDGIEILENNLVFFNALSFVIAQNTFVD